MVNREVLRLKKENEDLKKKVETQENPYKGFFIVIRPRHPGLGIANAAGLNIEKGEFQAHPPYAVDKHVFKVLRTRESALNYVNNVYPPEVKIKSSRVTSTKTPGLKNKPSMEEMRQDATQLGETGVNKAEEAKRTAEENRNQRKNPQPVSKLTKEDAENLLNQNSKTVLKGLNEYFEKGITLPDQKLLLATEKKKGKKKRKTLIDEIENLKVI